MERTAMKWILIATMFFSCAANAEVYKCEVNGVTTFSQDPCGNDALVITVEPPQKN